MRACPSPPRGKSLCTLQLGNLERKIASLLVSFFHGVNETCMPTKDNDIITHSSTSEGCIASVISKLGNKIWGLKF